MNIFSALFLCISFFLSSCHKTDVTNPQYFSSDNLVIPAHSRIEIKNTSEQSVLLDIAQHDGSAQAGYASILESQHISKFSHGGSQSLSFACYTGALKAHMPQVNCANILSVKVLSQDNNEGDYWTVENKLG